MYIQNPQPNITSTFCHIQMAYDFETRRVNWHNQHYWWRRRNGGGSVIRMKLLTFLLLHIILCGAWGKIMSTQWIMMDDGVNTFVQWLWLLAVPRHWCIYRRRQQLALLVSCMNGKRETCTIWERVRRRRLIVLYGKKEEKYL